MHAVIRKATSSANAKGIKSYKVAFSHPPAFWEYLNQLLGQKIDVFWDERLILRSAMLVGLKQKPVKDQDPDYLAELDCDEQDTSLANLQDEVNHAGDLRIAVPQGTLFSQP